MWWVCAGRKSGAAHVLLPHTEGNEMKMLFLFTPGILPTQRGDYYFHLRRYHSTWHFGILLRTCQFLSLPNPSPKKRRKLVPSSCVGGTGGPNLQEETNVTARTSMCRFPTPAQGPLRCPGAGTALLCSIHCCSCLGTGHFAVASLVVDIFSCHLALNF